MVSWSLVGIVHVMACGLTVPGHFLVLCCLIICEVAGWRFDRNFPYILPWYEVENFQSKFINSSPWDQWIKSAVSPQQLMVLTAMLCESFAMDALNEIHLDWQLVCFGLNAARLKQHLNAARLKQHYLIDLVILRKCIGFKMILSQDSVPLLYIPRTEQ